jgi:hypothetical protein
VAISFIFAPESVLPLFAPPPESAEFLPLPSVKTAVPFSFHAQALTSVSSAAMSAVFF